MAYETPYYLTFDDHESPSERLISAIAAIVGVRPRELSALYSAVDPDALDGMTSSSGEYSLSFEYEGFHITVHSDGSMLLRDPESIHATNGTISNALLLASETADDTCTDLQFPYPPSHENVLSVTTDRTASAVVNEWRHRDHEPPVNRKLISLADFTRSADTQSVTLPGSVEADLLSDPVDLSTLHNRIVQSLDAWQSNSYVTVLCFRSVETLLEEVGLDDVYSFLYSLTSRVADADALAHYHLDPLACDDEAITVLAPLFDAVVSDDGTGTTVLDG
ncbi:DUF7504 family protein [Natronolimnohabitans innermongolicus]|uniref:Halobacterial output domain-containing protein n=1 Tax=Natronolimnohabitans innermongolicus JCM 12255 TaxID=1227499 RepID=L9WP30_9EURY|nr:HalOD1 output domain-containing protein [Natronolimnohabitans innermongolicus]ELY50966.1 hypothetical protein C493_18311 [Natronolimnohabitans innermongolicus JCM 12255]